LESKFWRQRSLWKEWRNAPNGFGREEEECAVLCARAKE